MALRYSLEVRNAGVDARIAAIGASPILKIYSTAQKMRAGDDEGELVAIKLPATWMSKAEDGASHDVGKWNGKATGKGESKSFRIYGADEADCHIEGSIPEEMELNNPHLAPGQSVTVESFVIKSGNS
jgi:hypothetical protein